MKEKCMAYAKAIGAWCLGNRVFAGLLCLQVLLLGYLAVSLIGPRTVLTVPMTAFTAAWDTGAVTVSEDVLSIENVEGETSMMLLYSTPLNLGFGAYTIDVTYQSNTDPATEEQNIEDYPVALYIEHTVISTGTAKSTLILFLRDAATQITGRFWLPWQDSTNNITLYYTGVGQTEITAVQITEQPVWRVMAVLFVALLCLLVDGCYYLFFASGGGCSAKILQKIRVPLFICGIALVATVPSMTAYIYRGHDLPFHMVRIASVAAELSNGQFPVRMMTEMLNGYGYANSLFYCDIFLYIPALLYNCMVSLQTAYHIYVALVNLATCAIAYYCFEKLSHSRVIALTGAAIYTLASYRLTNLYTRGAVGEYTAMAFFPLVVLGVWNIYKAKKPCYRDWLPLALGMAGIIQCHVLSVEMVVVFLALCCLLLCKQTLQLYRIKAFALAAALCAGLTAWFWVPFVDSLRSMPLNALANVVDVIQGDGLLLSQLFSLGGYLSNGAESNTLSMPLGIGWGLLIGVGIAGYYMLQRSTLSLQGVREYQGMRVALCLGGISMAFTLTVFPWTAIGYGISARIATIVNVIQFPWRYLSIASICLAVVAVFALVLLKTHHKQFYLGAALLMLALTFFTTGLYYAEFVVETDTETRTQLERIDTQIIIFGEYLLDGSVVDENLPTVTTQDQGADVLAYEKVDGIAYLTCENMGDAAANFSLPIFSYTNYQARDTVTDERYAITTGENNRLVVTVPAGYQGTVAVAYVAPWYWHLAEGVTLLCWGLVAVLWIKQRKAKQLVEAR